MTVLSAQSIRVLSMGRWKTAGYLAAYFRPQTIEDLNIALYDLPNLETKGGLISPYVPKGESVNGRSFGQSACTYDCRISDGLVLPVGQARLASTIERFRFPRNVCGSVLDKSTWARVFVSAFNTHLDPGWEGYLTVELANLGNEAVTYEPGDPVCQVKFEWLDEPTDMPYDGKYQSQEPGPQPARYLNKELR
jgi:dCTP deaminase